MKTLKQKEEPSGPSGRLPKDYDDAALKAQLSGIQSRTRRLMDEHGIASDDMVSMARDAERTIVDETRRAEFLKLLIELQEFGGEAKRRGLLRNPAAARAAKQARENDASTAPAVAEPGRETGLFERQEAAGDEVDEDASRDFFGRLDG